MKKKLFIGSSTEELKLAQAAKALLDADFDVTIWNNPLWESAVFKINQNFLSDLMKATLMYDYGILLGTADDKLEYRGTEVLQPRDNVLFELGLFTGRLGQSKVALITEKTVKFPSDLQGITLARFEKTDSLSFITAVQQVGSVFKGSSDSEVNFFPSVTLAAVYFENLLRPICKYVIENRGFEVDGENYSKCRVRIIIPRKISEDVNIQFQKLKASYIMKEVSFKYAGRPRHISIDTRINDNTLEFVDFPTIITGINHAISNLMPNDFNALSQDYEAILERELSRFATTLKLLLVKNDFEEMVVIERKDNR